MWFLIVISIAFLLAVDLISFNYNKLASENCERKATGSHWDKVMTRRESACSVSWALFLLWISLHYFSSKLWNASLYWFQFALSGLQETAHFTFLMSLVTRHLPTFKILQSEYKKALLSTPDTGCLLSQNKNGTLQITFTTISADIRVKMYGFPHLSSSWWKYWLSLQFYLESL